jgi:peptide deformylase
LKYDVVVYGDPVLREKAVAVEKVDDSIRALAKDMLATMYDSNGLGLAAEQIGRTENLCVIDVPSSHDVDVGTGPLQNPDVAMPLVLVNPRVTETSGEETAQEGCLSFPEIFVSIKRAEELTVVFTDLDNKERSLRVRGLLARTVQHEMDHLHGVLLVDRMSAVQKVAARGKLKRLMKTTKKAVR